LNIGKRWAKLEYAHHGWHSLGAVIQVLVAPEPFLFLIPKGMGQFNLVTYLLSSGVEDGGGVGDGRGQLSKHFFRSSLHCL
jgi:hypothetical protein